MNLYFLVEGKTEQKVYPKWLAYLLPHYSRVDTPIQVSNNNYFLISGGGLPHLLKNHLQASIEDVNSSGRYDFLIVCLDSDDKTPEAKIKEVYDSIKEHQLELSCTVQVIVQQKCMETWFMGNQKIYSRNPSPKFKPFAQFYNVLTHDPELMGKPLDFNDTSSKYHCKYLKSMFLERGISYSKTIPGVVKEKYYLDELKKRLQNSPGHLNTLRKFLEFCNHLTA